GEIKTKLAYMDQRLDRLSPDEKLKQLKMDLIKLDTNLNRFMIYQLESKKHNVDQYRHTMKSPLERIKGLIEKRENLNIRLMRNIDEIAHRKGYQFEILKTALGALNPLLLMDKGFAVVTKDALVVTSIQQVNLDDMVSIRLKDGILGAKITQKKENDNGKENV
ncbi:MAG: exodeoxyribonuclease VII large subunit, partial [Bacillota bacterium]